MIFVDMKIFGLNKTVDIKFDETMTVEDLIGEIIAAFEIRDKRLQMVSVRNKVILNKKMTFEEQGILGGDTLMLI